MFVLVQFLIFLLNIYLYILIAMVVASWLVAFGVLNTGNKLVYTIYRFLNQATEPVMARVRQVIPPMGGIDISPLVIMIGIYLLQNLLLRMVY